MAILPQIEKYLKKDWSNVQVNEHESTIEEPKKSSFGGYSLRKKGSQEEDQ